MATNEPSRTALEDLRRSPYAIAAAVSDSEAARELIEGLEANGIPDTAITLVGISIETEPDPEEAVADSEAFSDLASGVVRGGIIWAIIGAVAGLVVSLLLTDLTWPWGVVFGFLFGAAIGGSFGGMSVAKYNSPAWVETYEAAQVGDISVGVHHRDEAVIDSAEAILQQHVHVGQLTRYSQGEIV